MGFSYVKTDKVIQGTTVTHRFRWQAERDRNRRQERLERRAVVPSLRWEVVPAGERWAVAMYQNVCAPDGVGYGWELEGLRDR